MFPSEKPGEWDPIRIRAKSTKPLTNGVTNGDHPQSMPESEIQDASNSNNVGASTNHVSDDPSAAVTTYEEDPNSTEGVVYPLYEGRIENWSCFFALLTHIYNTLSPPFHTPVLIISQPCWSARDHELLTQFFFENFKMPALCLMDSALATCYAYGVPTATVIDVGHQKCDVTAVSDFVVCDAGRGVAVPGCGGQGMTQKLLEVLGKRGFDENMCEQLKKSAACEILPVGTAMPGKMQEEVKVANPAAAASTGATESGAGAKEADGTNPGQAPRGPGMGTEVGEEATNGEEEENEGVLDVASIVAKGNASEFLAKREREKAEKAAAKKGADATRAARLKNSERERATFSYEDYVPVESHVTNGDGAAPLRKRKRDIEVGVERFMAAAPPAGANDGILDTIAATIHNTIHSVPDVSPRSTLWDNLIILGNGSRVRGKFTCSDSAAGKLLKSFFRLHNRPTIYPFHQIHSFAIHRHHLHFRASIQFLNPAANRRHEHAHSRSFWAGHASSRCTWCESASSRGNKTCKSNAILTNPSSTRCSGSSPTA